MNNVIKAYEKPILKAYLWPILGLHLSESIWPSEYSAANCWCSTSKWWRKEVLAYRLQFYPVCSSPRRRRRNMKRNICYYFMGYISTVYLKHGQKQKSLLTRNLVSKRDRISHTVTILPESDVYDFRNHLCTDEETYIFLLSLVPNCYCRICSLCCIRGSHAQYIICSLVSERPVVTFLFSSSDNIKKKFDLRAVVSRDLSDGCCRTQAHQKAALLSGKRNTSSVRQK